MTDNDALVCRAIKAAQAARDALWILAVRARLSEGPATSRELFDCVLQPIRGPFLARLYAMERAGLIAGHRSAQHHYNKLWRLPDQHQLQEAA